MFDNAIPSYGKFLMKNAKENGVLFEGRENPSKNINFFEKDLNFSVSMADDQKRKFKFFQQKLVYQKQKYDEYVFFFFKSIYFFKFYRLLMNLYQLQLKIFHENENLQTIIDETRNILTPDQYASFILNLENVEINFLFFIFFNLIILSFV